MWSVITVDTGGRSHETQSQLIRVQKTQRTGKQGAQETQTYSYEWQDYTYTVRTDWEWETQGEQKIGEDT